MMRGFLEATEGTVLAILLIAALLAPVIDRLRS